MLRYIFKITQYFIFDCDVNVTISDCYAAGAATKQLDIYVIVTHEELYSLEGYDAPIVIHVSFFWNFIRKCQELLSDDFKTKLFQVFMGHWDVVY